MGKKVFIVYVTSLSLNLKMSIYLTWKAQIALLGAEKVTILAKYLNFIDIFSKKSATKLSKRFIINKYLINLEPDKQLF